MTKLKTYLLVLNLVLGLAGLAQIKTRKIDFCGEELPISTAYVSKNYLVVIKGLVKKKDNIPALYQRAMIYFPYIVSILRENSIPDDFKYLAVIESNIQNVISPVGASGVWQIMPGASKDMGLKIDRANGIDERNDLTKSTIAVSKYLNWLHQRLDSWTLVAAAYNGGIGMIKKKIKTTGQSNFYLMPLNHETAEYVLKISAVKELFENQTNLEEQIFKFPKKKEQVLEDQKKLPITKGLYFNSIKLKSTRN